MTLAEEIRILLEQANGGSSGNGSGNGGSGNGGTSNGSGNGNGDGPTDGDGEKEPTPPKGFHGHHLRGYGRYYCSCDKDTPPHQRCPNCKARKD